MKKWLEVLVNGERHPRCVTLRSNQPFRESISFANRPVCIKGRNFASGVAMLTDGSIEVISETPITRFRSFVGLDDNDISRKMVLASVVFSIEAEGREVWRSNPLSTADTPQMVDIPINGVRSLILKAVMVNESARALKGYWAHADFADAMIEFSDGSFCTVARTLEEQRLDQVVTPPLSFRIGGRTEKEFFRDCRREVSVEKEKGKVLYKVKFIDNTTDLSLQIDLWQYDDFPAVEWIAYFINNSDKDSPLIENVRAINLFWPGYAPARLHCAKGSNSAADDFQYIIEELETIRHEFPVLQMESGSDVAINGRSSVKYLPFMNLDGVNDGIVLGIGWSGQWSAEICRKSDTGFLHISAGMDDIHLKLHSGESIRTPRILLLYWNGEPVDGNNLLRRYLLKHCVPQFEGKPVEAPSCVATWGGQPTPQHYRLIKRLMERDIKYDCYWVDAGWYGTSETPCPDVFTGEWWIRGDWRVNRNYHPDGLKPLSEKIHKAGMKFMLWVDIESAVHGTPPTIEHPEWFLSKCPEPRKEGDALMLNLGNPDALSYAVETIAQLIEKEGVDWYRQDFNLSSVIEYWRANDLLERQGITQIKHIEGLYAFWDELRRRFPELLIDNCAGGGRRIDLETVSRSIPLWRSDYGCFAEAKPEGFQVHSSGLTLWVPLSAGGSVCPPGDTYYFRSNLSAGLVEGGFCNEACFFEEFLAGKEKYPWDWYRKMLAEYYRARPLFYGDFYPLTEINLSSHIWLAYQLHRPDIEQGMVIAFRREQSPHPVAVFQLKGLSVNRRYCFENADSGECLYFTGKRIKEKGFKILLPEPRSCCLFFYQSEDR
ncbi:MAG TPA: alpha-galactosidase [bacterium]|nr:alpha-galactosidase [bacterium]HPP29893.1 alpha-galactosidase [bacterium]